MLPDIGYRKERRSALMKHYRRSEWVKGIPVWLVCLGWFPQAMLEMWLLAVYAVEYEIYRSRR